MAADIVPLRPTAPLALARAFAVVTWGALASAAVILGMIIPVGIADEEDIISFPSTVDAALRSAAASLLIFGIGGPLLEVPRRMLDAALTARAAADRRAPDAARLPRLDHARLKEGPGAGLLILGLFLLVLGPCVALVDVVSGFDFDGIALATGLALTGLGVLALVLRRRMIAAHSRRIAGIPGPVRGQQIPAARERRTGRRWLFIAGVVLQLGLGVFYVGILLRQPCRGCDRRSYGDSWIEGAIDVFVGLGVVAIALPVLLLAVTSLPAVISSLRTERETRRRAADGSLSWTHDVAVQLRSTGTWFAVAHVVAVVGFVVLGAGLIPLVGSDSVVNDEERAALAPLTNAIGPGAALIAVGLALGIVAQFESASRRAAIHRALPGHDVRAKVKDASDA